MDIDTKIDLNHMEDLKRNSLLAIRKEIGD